jgi:hypothetical protein
MTCHTPRADNVFFLILHLFQFWIGTLACLEGMLGLDGHMVVSSGSVEVQSSSSLAVTRAIVPHTAQPRALIQPLTAIMSPSLEDEDLLDY